MAGRRVTLRDLAKALELSPGTVSKALRNDPAIHPETRRLVTQAAEAMGYETKHLRAGPVAGGPGAPRFAVSSRLGRRLPDSHEPVIQGIRRFVDEGLGAILLYDEAATPSRAELRRCLGAIAVMPDGPTPFIRACKAAGVPVAVINRRFEDVAVCVRNDDLKASELLFNHIVALGHRSVGYVGRGEGNLAMRARHRAIERLCAEAGLPFVALWLPGGQGAETSTARALRELRAACRWPSVWICGSDNVALDVLKALKNLGIPVPEDTAVTGMHNLDCCELVDPPLTTVDFHLDAMGYWAAKQLAHGLPEEGARVDMLFEPVLVVRGSCGAQSPRPALTEA